MRTWPGRRTLDAFYFVCVLLAIYNIFRYVMALLFYDLVAVFVVIIFDYQTFFSRITFAVFTSLIDDEGSTRHGIVNVYLWSDELAAN